MFRNNETMAGNGLKKKTPQNFRKCQWMEKIWEKQENGRIWKSIEKRAKDSEEQSTKTDQKKMVKVKKNGKR